MMMPSLVPFFLFSLIPLLYVLFISFTAADSFTSFRWVGLDNYALMLRDGAWWHSVRNTFIFAFGKLIVEIPLALVLAVILNQRLRGSAFFQTLFFIPHVTSIAIIAIAFYFLLTPYQGVLNELLELLGVISRPIDYLGQPTSALLSVMLISIWHGFGINTVLFLAGLQTVSAEVLESADLDGANPAQKLFYVTLPMLGATFRVVVLLALVFTMRSFDLVKVLTDGGPYGSTEIMFTYIFDYFFSSDRAAQYGYGAALGVVAALIIALLSLGLNRLTRRLEA